MTDRNDPSQYDADQGNANDQTFYGDTSMDNHQIQSAAEGVYAEPADLVGYHNVGAQDDYLNQSAGKFKTGVKGEYTVAVSRSIPGASGAIVTAPAHISGWSVRETTGVTPAVITFRDGLDVGNKAVITISLAPGESARDFLTLPIETTRAIFLEIVSGSVDGNLYTVEKRYV
jgi:hypothetical protein